MNWNFLWFDLVYLESYLEQEEQDLIMVVEVQQKLLVG
jgi:hypothetical protein